MIHKLYTSLNVDIHQVCVRGGRREGGRGGREWGRREGEGRRMRREGGKEGGGERRERGEGGCRCGFVLCNTVY